MRPHEERVIEEKRQLDDKIAKLSEFGKGEIFASLPAEEQGRLNRQHSIMETYSDILSERIASFPSDN